MSRPASNTHHSRNGADHRSGSVAAASADGDTDATSPTYGTFSAVDYNGNPALPTAIKPVLGIVAAMPPRDGTNYGGAPAWVNINGNPPLYAQNWGIGFNVSEPLASSTDYYDAPDYVDPLGPGPANPTASGTTYYADDFYYDEASAAMGMMPPDSMPTNRSTATIPALIGKNVPCAMATATIS